MILKIKTKYFLTINIEKMKKAMFAIFVLVALVVTLVFIPKPAKANVRWETFVPGGYNECGYSCIRRNVWELDMWNQPVLISTNVVCPLNNCTQW
jgi:hypothetical protein